MHNTSARFAYSSRTLSPRPPSPPRESDSDAITIIVFLLYLKTSTEHLLHFPMTFCIDHQSLNNISNANNIVGHLTTDLADSISCKHIEKEFNQREIGREQRG